MRSFLLPFTLALGLVTAAVAQKPNPFDRFDPPVLGPWEKYGGAPSGVELKPAVIPAAFRGEWNDPITDCGAGRSDMRLRIGPNTVRFYESGGEVRRIVRHNAKAITVLASYSGEGEVWDRVDRFVLSGSGNELSAKTGQDEGVVRYRCPTRKTKK